MINTREVAEALVTGEMDVSDLIDDVGFLEEVNESLKRLMDDDGTGLSHARIARQRKLVYDRIAAVLDRMAGEDGIV